MKLAVLIPVNILLIWLAFYLYFKKDLLSYLKGGRWWLTFLAIGVITLMDELTSIFYAPAEAFIHIGIFALMFIPFTALFIHYMTTRLVEIAEILDVHGLKGGGVYNFSYLVLGPVVSFVAVSSIMVDYILTASLSTVSAIENITSFLSLGSHTKIILEIIVIWLVAGLNILGIRENMKVTFGIFLVTALVLLNLVFSSFFHMGAANIASISTSWNSTWDVLKSSGLIMGYAFFIKGISSCILAYSGVESVLQTASLVENWKTIGRAYLFLGLSVGLFTPLISTIVLSTPGIDFHAHQNDLITFFAILINGKAFGILVAFVACITLLMAMNTAYVASSELVERVAHRYNFRWIVKTNSRASLYRVHIFNGILYSTIILITNGKQGLLAEMYAVGLVATFVINMGTLLIYRYFQGTKEVRAYNVSRFGTLIFFLVILSTFIYLAIHKKFGFLLWLICTAISLLVGIYGTKRRAPEIVQEEKGDTPMDIVFYIAESTSENVHIYFKRPLDSPQDKTYDLSMFVTFYSPRQPIPVKNTPNHFRIPFKRASVYQNIVAILTLLIYEFPKKNITIHFGWPTSSWFDRLSTGVMVFRFMTFPKMFPTLNFRIEKFKLITG